MFSEPCFIPGWLGHNPGSVPTLGLDIGKFRDKMKVKRILLGTVVLLVGFLLLSPGYFSIIAPLNFWLNYEHLDKVAHFVIFAGFSIFSSTLARNTRITKAHANFVGLSFALTAGAMTEGIQNFIPGRSASLTDLLADSLGASIGALAYYLWQRKG